MMRVERFLAGFMKMLLGAFGHALVDFFTVLIHRLFNHTTLSCLEDLLITTYDTIFGV